MTTPLVTRRTALKALGATAGALLPWLSDDGLAAYAEIQAKKTPPRPKVLTAAQYATVETLVETLIPTDERSPGAREARVADYIDLLLSEADAPLRQQWVAGLAALDAEAMKRFGAPLVRLPEGQMTALLTDISQYEVAKPKAEPALEIARNEQPKPPPPLEAFFANTKQATIHGYYTSEIGIHKDLRYKGNQILAEFVGCETVDGKDCPHCGRKAKA